MILGLALILNVNFSSAATVNQTSTVKVATTHSLTSVSTINTSKKVSGGLTLAQIKDGFKRAQKFYNTNYRLPNYVSYGSKKIPIVNFQKIIASQGLKLKKPKLSSSTLTSNSTLAQIMKSASRFRYSGSAHTGAAMERIGSGDCWAMSDYLYTHMVAAGMKARIIQYGTAYSSNHRSVQYLSSGKWVGVPYRKFFSTNMFNDTRNSGAVIACNV